MLKWIKNVLPESLVDGREGLHFLYASESVRAAVKALVFVTPQTTTSWNLSVPQDSLYFCHWGIFWLALRYAGSCLFALLLLCLCTVCWQHHWVERVLPLSSAILALSLALGFVHSSIQDESSAWDREGGQERRLCATGWRGEDKMTQLGLKLRVWTYARVLMQEWIFRRTNCG